MSADDNPRLRWNEFQKLHRGRGWTQQQMSEQWRAYKALNVSTKHQLNKQQTYLHKWMHQLGPRNSYICTQQQQDRNSSDTCAHDDAAAVQTPLRQTQPCQTNEESQDAATPLLHGIISPLTPNSCSSISTSSQTNCDSQQQHCADSPVVQTKAKSWLQHQQQQSMLQPSPTPSPCSSKQSPGIPTYELAKLRAAVQHLMAGQKGFEQHLQDTATEHAGSSSSAYPYGTTQIAATTGVQQPEHYGHAEQQQQFGQGRGSSTASVGCLSFVVKGLNWNSFQKACKGRGMTKAELSAAWKHYKHTGTMPDWWQDQQQQQQQREACTAWPSEQQQQQQDREQHHKVGKWGALKEWVQSRASSRAVSRAVSRTVSRMVSPAQTPQHSPPKAKPAKQHHHHQQQGTPAAVEAQCIVLDSEASKDDTHVMQQQEYMARHAQEAESQQQQQLPASWVAESQPGTVGGTCAAAVTAMQACRETMAAGFATSTAISTGTATICMSGSSTGASSQTGGGLDTSSSSSISLHSRRTSSAAGTSAKEHRKVRELVPHDSPGLLSQFSDWMPVSLQPGKLKQLKLAIPAKPGLYEWGVRLPVGVTTADLAAAEAVAAAGKIEGVKTRSGLQTGRPRLFFGQPKAPTTEYGPVICFYLGKAGILSGGRQNRPRLAAATASDSAPVASPAACPGETLRTRFNKYALTKAGRLGPSGEPHKDAFFEQLQAAGGLLHYRWCVTVDAQPIDIERQLLEQLDYAANVVNNGRRRALLVSQAAQYT